MKKSNWKKIQKRNDEDNLRYINVHENQQLDRSKIGEKESMIGRYLLTILLSIIITVCIYFLVIVCRAGFYSYQVWISPEYDYLFEEIFFYAFSWYSKFDAVNLGISSFACVMSFLIILQAMQNNHAAQNLMNDTADINQYQNDQYIALPEEVQLRYDWFPDIGAHSSVQVSSMISHMALSNKGIKKISVVKRATSDIVADDGTVVVYKGEQLKDEKGHLVYEEKKFFDEKLMSEIFDVCETLKKNKVFYNPKQIPYSHGKKIKQAGDYKTVAEMINNDWVLPDYEPQRPTGAYVVQTEPVNTMLLAITRGGKGQTVIEPTIDMWTREKKLNNIVINDPKGELLVKFYERGVTRGYQIIQFNLINALKTDICNLLGLASEAAREGDYMKCAQYIEGIGSVFFPVDGADDPLWPQAANNAFKRSAYGLIDYYLEEEAELRKYAEEVGMDEIKLNNEIDKMWGHVTLYNCYQMFVQFTSKLIKNPKSYLDDENENENENSDKYDKAKIYEYTEFWKDKAKEDMLSLYFNATAELPQNGIRQLLSNADNSLKSMGGASKMLTSVYGIAITTMSFFTDPIISTLTSGRPSQNIDLAGISFPRRIGIRLHPEFVAKYHLVGAKCIWTAYSDRAFTQNMGKDFVHEDMLTREGWVKYYVNGIFPYKKTFIKLEIRNMTTNNLLFEWHFSFEKTYQKTLNGRHYIQDAITNKKVVRDGVLTELKATTKDDGTVIYKDRTTHKFTMKKVENLAKGEPKLIEKSIPTITMKLVRYSEQPKMIFFVTPPHLMQYAKLLLIVIKQLVDMNFEQSYMTKKNQKPLLKTRFMLDELGNLQSDGKGIQGLETMLSIGLGQDQQFTIILQTLQQLRSVYGDDVDRIIQGNTANIIYLKSNDIDMINTLVELSGVTHESYVDQKTVTKDLEKMLMKNEGKTTYTMTTRESTVLKKNDFLFISPSNSIVFSAGDAPIWNRNETILPKSYKMFENTIKQPGKEYSLLTIPTMSSAKDFDVRKNQPDFTKMFEKRLAQAAKAKQAKEVYQKAYGYSDYEITQIDRDEYSKEIMELINQWNMEKLSNYEGKPIHPFDKDFTMQFVKSESNINLRKEVINNQQKEAKRNEKIFAGGMLAPANLVDASGNVIGHSLDTKVAILYDKIKGHFTSDDKFIVKDGNLYLKSEGILLIEQLDINEFVDALNNAATNSNSSVFAESELSENDVSAASKYQIMDDFYRWLSEQSTWSNIANGKFEIGMSNIAQ